MNKNSSIIILGEGRIAQAVFYYLKKLSWIRKLAFFSSLPKNQLKEFSLIISCLPGKDASLGLELALKYRMNLLDVSDLDPPYYIKRKREIEKAKIFVIPGCGFCPGLVNFVVGREVFLDKDIDGVVIKAGSLASQKFFFPFLWCFEDLIQEHKLPSWQIIEGKKKKFTPFSGYENEEFLGIPVETYFSVSGFENMLKEDKFLNFHFRVIRPRGFREFFNFLDNYGFFDKVNIEYTKRILENCKRDNYTIAQIDFLKGDKRIISWLIRAFSRKQDRLNSMQKITAVVPAVLCEVIFLNGFSPQGLIFMEEVGKNLKVFEQVIRGVKDKGIILKRRRKSKIC